MVFQQVRGCQSSFASSKFHFNDGLIFTLHLHTFQNAKRFSRFDFSSLDFSSVGCLAAGKSPSIIGSLCTEFGGAKSVTEPRVAVRTHCNTPV